MRLIKDRYILFFVVATCFFHAFVLLSGQDSLRVQKDSSPGVFLLRDLERLDCGNLSVCEWGI